MTERYIRVGANERTEVDSLTRSYCKGRTFVREGGTLCLCAVHLGYMRANGLEAPVEGPTLETCKKFMRGRYALR
jgi:hypothetical protein